MPILEWAFSLLTLKKVLQLLNFLVFVSRLLFSIHSIPELGNRQTTINRNLEENTYKTKPQ
jgi:hypothetical protein